MCIHCATPVESLYMRYGKDHIVLTPCISTSCNSDRSGLPVLADEYLEHHMTVVVLDLILAKPKAYRHLLYNRASILAPPRPELRPASGKWIGGIGQARLGVGAGRCVYPVVLSVCSTTSTATRCRGKMDDVGRVSSHPCRRVLSKPIHPHNASSPRDRSRLQSFSLLDPPASCNRRSQSYPHSYRTPTSSSSPSSRHSLYTQRSPSSPTWQSPKSNTQNLTLHRSMASFKSPLALPTLPPHLAHSRPALVNQVPTRTCDSHH